TLTQRSVDFIQSHTRTVEYFGGVSAVVVPDQLRTGVVDPCRYEPRVQRTYADWARHYGTAIVPARPAKPRDKAKVEVAVQVAERWILARLRNETFFTLAALNARIAELLTDLNDRPMKGYGGASRRTLFERFDQPALQPLLRDRLGRHHRPTYRGASPSPARKPAASRARLSLVPGHPPVGEAARPRAARRRLRPGGRRRRAVVSPRRIDPQTRPGPSAP